MTVANGSSHPVKAVLFDLDGTLLDTVRDLHSAANLMLSEMSLPLVTEQTVRNYVGRGIGMLVKRLLQGQDADPDGAPPATELTAFRRHYAKTNGKQSTLYEGVLEGLNAFREADIAMGVVTNKAQAFVGPLLRQVGLSDYFQTVVSGDSLPRQKPDPMPLIWACGYLGVTPQETCLVGDSETDFRAARAAGCGIFLVPYGYNENRNTSLLSADRHVSTLREAAEYLIA